MTDLHPNGFVASLQLVGRFLYRLLLAVAIVWILGLIVQGILLLVP